MGKRVYILSKFLGTRGDYNIFHFNGCYRGEKIREIRVIDGNFQNNEEYLLAIEEIEISNRILIGKHLKSKMIFT